jgi:hypothetical protein
MSVGGTTAHSQVGALSFPPRKQESFSEVDHPSVLPHPLDSIRAK